MKKPHCLAHLNRISDLDDLEGNIPGTKSSLITRNLLWTKSSQSNRWKLKSLTRRINPKVNRGGKLDQWQRLIKLLPSTFPWTLSILLTHCSETQQRYAMLAWKCLRYPIRAPSALFVLISTPLRQLGERLGLTGDVLYFKKGLWLPIGITKLC